MGKRDIVHPDVDRYVAGLVPPGEGARAAMEQRAAAEGFPIVGPQVGRLLELLVRTSGAQQIFELGSGFGYSAYWFGRALPAAGRLVLTDGSAARLGDARRYLGDAALACEIRYEAGDALATLRRPEYAGPWDIVFCDVDKEDYPAAAELGLAHLRPGGLFICDNALWSGRVVDAQADSPATAGVMAMNRALAARDDVTSIIPLRDGVSVTVKV